MSDWCISVQDERIVVEGEVVRCSGPAFCHALDQALPAGLAVDMRDLEIEDGVAMALTISTIRRHLPIRILYAPQMLAHTLYKIGMLDSERVELVFPRSDRN